MIKHKQRKLSKKSTTSEDAKIKNLQDNLMDKIADAFNDVNDDDSEESKIEKRKSLNQKENEKNLKFLESEILDKAKNLVKLKKNKNKIIYF